MASIQNLLMDFFLWIKIMIFGTKFLIQEALCSIPPLDGKLHSFYLHTELSFAVSCNMYSYQSILFLDPIKRDGEYAVITGGNRGIGWHTVKGLVNSGMKVIVGNILYFTLRSRNYINA